ncbi:MAG: class I SAM-dependent methyltransferase [Pseudomonadota bacterium]|nr:class I SAM-dependent methyltransferase [Pseudomonadota bacterium]
MQSHIAIVIDTTIEHDRATALATQLHLPIIQHDAIHQYDLILQFLNNKLSLQLTAEGAPGPISVDFLAGKYAHRRQYGGGKSQLLAKAIGLHKFKSPSVIDVTAGLGQDAFILASLGCNVQMIERSPIIAALVSDALERAKNDPLFSSMQFTLTIGDSLQFLQQLTQENYPDIIYIDPMFPTRTKSALVKKEMRVLRAVVGDDVDADQLLYQARQIAKKRVVVKRPRHAPVIANQIPTLQLKGESSRFDVYVNTEQNDMDSQP